MTPYDRILKRAWILVAACACAFVAWSTHVRVQRAVYVTGLAAAADAQDPRSPTGYAGGLRELIIPERNEASFHWISQTQQMFAQGQFRVRHVDYENAPRGREVTSPSPYRWWLGLVAYLDHSLSGRPLGMSVERAALYADPLLQAILVLGASAFVAWRFGGFAAALVSVGLVGLFPFSSGFLPGMPDDQGLAQILALGSLLALLAGLHVRSDGDGGPTEVAPSPWFAVSGIVGGLGMWVSVSTQVPVTLGIIAGALAMAWLPDTAGRSLPWRTWSLCGGSTVIAAYLAEYFPGHMASWDLGAVHPVYGLAWMGAGELLSRALPAIRGEKPSWTARDGVAVGVAIACVATVPGVMWTTGTHGFLSRGLQWARLTGLPNGPVAASSRDWLGRDGATLGAWATLLPLAILVPVLWLALRRATPPGLRASMALVLGPAAVALAFAWGQLSWWGMVDVALLAALVVAAAGEWKLAGVRGRWIVAGITLAWAIPGIAQLKPQAFAGTATVLTPQESRELVDRHLAHWLARRTGEPGPVVFGPPLETTTLAFYGSLRGIGSFAPDNKAGFGGSLGIAGARSMGEAQVALEARGVRYIVMPSWDPFFDDFSRLYVAKGMSGRPSLFADELRHWDLPLWLQAVPYQLPVGGGFEGQSVLVFEVVDEQSPAAAASRLAEYLVETGDLADAAVVAQRLGRFQGDVGALAAQAQVQAARGDADSAARTLDALLARMSSAGDHFLSWDRRVSVAVVLARAQRYELSREQVRRCMGEASDARLRSLSTGSLYDLLVLAHSFQVEFPDPRLRDLALDLLPGDLRNGL
jgi:hypothetical protein